MTLLDVKNLSVTFPVRSPILRRRIGNVHAVRGIDFAIAGGETLAIVGESGSGKSTVARAIGRLIPAQGSVTLSGTPLLDLSPRELRSARRHLQYVFQDPYSSLNRRWTIGASIAEPLETFKIGERHTRRERVASLLSLVGLDPTFATRHPRALSGGQRQRVGIARALALNPKLVICDEAISALDVSVQAQILNLLTDLRRELGLSYLFITHDLGVVRRFAHRVAVMHAGAIVEIAPTGDLFEEPLHPYSAALLSAVPKVTQSSLAQSRIRLSGGPPSPLTSPAGCLFAKRCPVAEPRCHTEAPPLAAAMERRQVACHRVVNGIALWRSATPLQTSATAADRTPQ